MTTIDPSCTRCGKPLPGTPPGTRIPVCLTCQTVMMNAPAEAPIRSPARPRRKWPWLVVAFVVAAGVGGFVWREHARHARDMIEMRYPVVATDAERSFLEAHAKPWAAGRNALVAAAASLDPATIAEVAGPCVSFATPTAPPPSDDPVTQRDLAQELERDDPDELTESVLILSRDLPARVEQHVTTLLAAADRGRFHSVRGRRRILRAIGLPLLVVQLEVDHHPSAVAVDSAIGVHYTFDPGHRAGIAYVFDAATGKLECSGRFDAVSSSTIKTVTEGTSGAVSNRDEALAADLEANTVDAIRASVHAAR